MKLVLDPRTKLFILVMINLMVVMMPSLTAELACMGAIALLLLLMGAFTQMFRGLVFYALLMGALRLCGFFPHNYFSALVSMLVICLRRIVPTVFFASGMIAVTKAGDLISAMQKMRIPKSIVIPFAVTLRFFPTAREEFACIRDAMRLRGIGFGPKNILTRPLAVLEWILVPMMLRCAGIAEELSAAAAARGIDGGNRRSSMNVIRFRAADLAAAGAFSCLVFWAIPGKGGGLP